MTIRPAAGAARRTRLLLLVYSASLLLVAAAGIALVVVVSEHVSASAIEASVASDRSLVRGVVAEILGGSDVTGPVPDDRAAQIQRSLGALVDKDGGGIYHIKVWARDGRVLFSNRPELRGQVLGADDELDDVFDEGVPVSSIVDADEGEASTTQAPAGTRVLEEYLPVGQGSTVTAVFEVYRDAAPILHAIDATVRDVVGVTIIAGLVLAVVLRLIFAAAQRRLNLQTEELLESSRRDALTGMLSHGTAAGVLAELVDRARDGGGGIGVALVDIDNFRLLNDTHGHAAGDHALVEVARILRRELSDATTLGRFGPDEFVAVAPPECVHDLEPAIARLREALAGLSLQFGASERLPCSVSAGVAYFPVHGETATQLLSVASEALAEAKASGGDSVRVADLSATDLETKQRSSFDVLTNLVVAVDTKDRYTKRHSEDVARYAVFLADRVGVDPDLRRTIEIAGLLHDVGKIGIPDAILRKPAALTAEEYEIVKQHVALGDRIVRDLPNLDVVRAGVRHHHERWDGSGYLDALAGESIPLVARILAVGDAFSAMTSSRPYRKALSVQEALRRLEDAAGSQLDPMLVRAFVTSIETAADAPLPGDGRTLAQPFVLRSAGAA